MENIIYNDRRVRGCEVDIGIVYGTGKNKSGQSVQLPREIDFIATRENEEKAMAENRPLALARDSFPKVIVRHDMRKR